MSASGKKVAVIVADGFEDSEATSPIQALQEAGADVTVLGLKTGTVTGKKGATVEATDTIASADPAAYDLLVIPGGGSPENLRIEDEAVDFARRFADSGKPIGAICHGPQLLISADALKGRTLTAVSKIRDDIRNAGATYVDEEVHVDGNIISSRIPDDLPAFNRAIIAALG